ncbi:NADP-binding protein, partial [Dacryopinax primogenitus]
HQSVYAGIHPSKFRDSYKGKVVFITGASRGIGKATAYAFAECGASLFLVSRNQATIDKTVKEVETRFPGTHVGTALADVVRHEQVGEAFRKCIELFGKVDVVISNSGAMEVLGISEFYRSISMLKQARTDVLLQRWRTKIQMCGATFGK